MKAKSNFPRLAFTLIEAMIVTGILCVLIVMVVPMRRSNRGRSPRINCVNNQKQISLAFKQWSLDHGDKFPMQESVTNGGAMELVNSGIVWPHFQIMSNELNTPKLLVCPADEGRSAASSFESNFNNSVISYFVGVDAKDDLPNSFLVGDSNLSISGTNLSRGLVAVLTNMPLAWTERRHQKQGNVALADGSVQGFSNTRMREALRLSGLVTNRLAIP